jgi:hypothetical protein
LYTDYKGGRKHDGRKEGKNALSIISFDFDEEALALVNDTEYGLSAAVFTKDLE